MRQINSLVFILLLSLAALSGCSLADSGNGAAGGADQSVVEEGDCRPTRADALGPFYKPGAPQRSKVGEGYLLSGTVQSAEDCAPIPGAQIEFWLAGPDGIYNDEYRAMMMADAQGAYTFESHLPPAYAGRPPHIHIRVSAEAYGTLVTQHYPQTGETGSVFDLVLEPES